MTINHCPEAFGWQPGVSSVKTQHHPRNPRLLTSRVSISNRRKRAVLSCAHAFGSLANQLKMFFPSSTVICPELQNSQASLLEVLLFAQIFVADDEQIEPVPLRCFQQLTIFKFAPAQSRGGVNLVTE